MTDEQEHMLKLIAIHERRIAIYEERIKRLGGRDRLPIVDLMQLEEDEQRVEELREKAAGAG
jgi:cupin superfamily acireductone dioxygenase involved in methionine salvage